MSSVVKGRLECQQHGMKLCIAFECSSHVVISMKKIKCLHQISLLITVVMGCVFFFLMQHPFYKIQLSHLSYLRFCSDSPGSDVPY